jgi:hypothetical protein
MKKSKLLKRVLEALKRNEGDKKMAKAKPFVSTFVPPVGAPEEVLSGALSLVQNPREAFFNLESEDGLYPSEVLKRLGVTGHAFYLDESPSHILDFLKRYHIEFKFLNNVGLIHAFERSDEAAAHFRSPNFVQGGIEFKYKGHLYQYYCLQDNKDYFQEDGHDFTILVARSFEEAFLFQHDLSLYDYKDPNSNIYVFDGRWMSGDKLAADIAGLSWDHVILPPALEQEIKDDTRIFFTGSDEVYARLSIPKKRGHIYYGPPGNGKTTVAKILANEIEGISFIYVKLFYGRSCTAEEGIERVYQVAEAQAPAIVLIEDLDSQINAKTRSLFLNTLDGFDAPDRVLTIGTTNNPQFIDPALLNRPSRFDRKWRFGLPRKEERARYLKNRIEKFTKEETNEEMQGLIDEVLAPDTRSFSMAMMQELIVSAGYEYVMNEEKKPFKACLVSALHTTQAQMATFKVKPKKKPSEEEDDEIDPFEDGDLD